MHMFRIVTRNLTVFSDFLHTYFGVLARTSPRLSGSVFAYAAIIPSLAIGEMPRPAAAAEDPLFRDF